MVSLIIAKERDRRNGTDRHNNKGGKRKKVKRSEWDGEWRGKTNNLMERMRMDIKMYTSPKERREKT
jgi:hypothetical protein